MTRALGGRSVWLEPLYRTSFEEVVMPKGVEKPKDPPKKKPQKTIKQRRRDRRAARGAGSS
jgi:hypothetical protein